MASERDDAKAWFQRWAYLVTNAYPHYTKVMISTSSIDWNDQTEADLAKELAAARAAGFREGVERAARECDKVRDRSCASAIRALTESSGESGESARPE